MIRQPPPRVPQCLGVNHDFGGRLMGQAGSRVKRLGPAVRVRRASETPYGPSDPPINGWGRARLAGRRPWAKSNAAAGSRGSARR